MKTKESTLGVMDAHVLDFRRKLSLFPTTLNLIPDGHKHVKIPLGLARNVETLALIQPLRSKKERAQLMSGLKQLIDFEKYFIGCKAKMSIKFNGRS